MCVFLLSACVSFALYTLLSTPLHYFWLSKRLVMTLVSQIHFYFFFCSVNIINSFVVFIVSLVKHFGGFETRKGEKWRRTLWNYKWRMKSYYRDQTKSKVWSLVMTMLLTIKWCLDERESICFSWDTAVFFYSTIFRVILLLLLLLLLLFCPLIWLCGFSPNTFLLPYSPSSLSIYMHSWAFLS